MYQQGYSGHYQADEDEGRFKDDRRDYRDSRDFYGDGARESRGARDGGDRQRRGKDYSRERGRDYDRYQDSGRERGRERDRDAERGRDRDRNEGRDRNRDSDRSRGRDKYHEPDRDRGRDRYREKSDDGFSKEKELRREQANREREMQRSKAFKLVYKIDFSNRPTLFDIGPPGYQDTPVSEYKHLKAIGSLPVMAIPQGSTIILRARRLYIENLPEGTDPDEFVEFINTEMKNRNIGIKPGDPALSLDMGHDGETAYLEFRTSEECDAALALDGVEFKGKSVKIVRPNDYQPHNGYYFGCPHVFQDTLNKLFVACIPVHLTDDQVRELLTAFGELKAFNLVKDGASGLSKGYAFCEYRDGTVTDIAISGLNGMQISDKKLVVQRAVLGSRAGTNLGGIIPSVMQVPGVDPDHIISHDLLVTEVLCLINCLTDKDLEDDREYEDILEDVRQECSKYGEVLSVQIPRTDPNNPEITFEHVGKIFVEFGDKENCKEAHESLAGRKFNDRMVLTTFYDLDKYKRGEL